MERDGGPTEAPGLFTCVLMLSYRDSVNGVLIHHDLGGIIHLDRGVGGVVISKLESERMFIFIIFTQNICLSTHSLHSQAHVSHSQ